MDGCERKIPHECRYRENNLLLIIANDYYENFNLTNIDSTLNDISLVWNFFKRFRCFNDEQIFIFGRIDFKGKIIPWEHRFTSPSIDIPSGKKIYLYYTGHGYSNGILDINPLVEKYLNDNRESVVLFILDTCWSHTWMGKYDSYICNTVEKMETLSSSKYFSSFTLNFIQFLMENKGIKTIEDIRTWTHSKDYHFKCKSEKDIIEFIN